MATSRRKERNLPPIRFDDQRSAEEFVRAVEVRLRAIETAFARGYSVTNPTVKRDLDVAAATLAELRQVVGTLIQDAIDTGAIDHA